MAYPPDTVLKKRYRVVRIVAQGGSGQVYEAFDHQAGRRVALKAIPGVGPDGAALRRFKREAQLLTKLRHAGVPQVYDFWHEDGVGHLVMEFVDGRTLAQILPRGFCMPLAAALVRIRSLATVLAYLHAQKPPVVFRDLKPENIIIADDDTEKLIDFGIAWAAGGTIVKTQAMGTPGFAAPEQYLGGECDTRMDIYGLGATAYRMLTGQDPPPAVSRLGSRDPLAGLEGVPRPVAALLARMMELQPQRRPQTVQDVLAAMDRLED